jgi:hypothetical protein
VLVHRRLVGDAGKMGHRSLRFVGPCRTSPTDPLNSSRAASPVSRSRW